MALVQAGCRSMLTSGLALSPANKMQVALKPRPSFCIGIKSFLAGPQGWTQRQSHTRPSRLSERRPISIRAATVSSNDFKTGLNIVVDGAPYRVQEFLHVKPGKGSAFVRSKLKNYITNNTVEKTFRAGESVEAAEVDKRTKQYTYNDGEQLVFMDMETYEEIRVTKENVGDMFKWLKEGSECEVVIWNGRVLAVELPSSVVLKVTDTDPGVRGDTAQGGSKPCTVETGGTLQVPLFVNIGDDIIIDTRAGGYISRAKDKK
eukprot:TRINITY_DN18516_c0_g1_i1.p1 TRINITY_DN18516_c0_g1~~TRINITY_DN18516_c0_g1_i1.p1  ORF type:complete len:288 (-),score=53.82 TRINITY_DN18516_c0_g1_i1:292-1074(-)